MQRDYPGYEITTDATRIPVDAVHAFLARESYWAKDIPHAKVAAAMAHSLCFGVLKQGELVGFARVVSDRATFAYLCDVFVVEAERGQGLATWLLDGVMKHPDLLALRRWLLVTRDQQALYQRFGFTALQHHERHMERHDADVYQRQVAA